MLTPHKMHLFWNMLLKLTFIIYTFVFTFRLLIHKYENQWQNIGVILLLQHPFW